jgi:hypothetical protein
MFSPLIATLIHAINNNFLEEFPFMKNELVRKYLVRPPATSKGRMKRHRTGIRSTRPKDHNMIAYHITTRANLQPIIEPQDPVPESSNFIP